MLSYKMDDIIPETLAVWRPRVSTKKVTESVKMDEMETSTTGFHRRPCSVPSPLSSP